MGIRSAIIMLAALALGASGASALEIKDVAYQTEGAGKVVFSHQAHLKKKTAKSANVSCKACHATPRDAKKKHTMADMEQGKSCGKCHDGRKAFSVSKCTACHKVKNITYKVKQTGPVLFSHTNHLKSMQCNACHNALYATGSNKAVSMADMEKGKSCGPCHDDKEAFSVSQCEKCHPVREVKFKVNKAGDVSFSHSTHLGMYKCNDCHTGTFPTKKGSKPVSMAEMKNAKSCGACHDGEAAFTVNGNCDSCHVRG